MKLEDTVVWRQLRQQEATGRKRSALITDIDNTLYQAEHGGAVRAAWELRNMATEAPYPIVAVTGAAYDALVRGRLERGVLPSLEVVVGSVGTEIWFLHNDGSYKKDQTYGKQLQSTGYKRFGIAQTVKTLLPKLQQEGLEINFQDPAKEAAYLKKPDPAYLPYKMSLHFFANKADWPKVAAKFKQIFQGLKIVVCEEINYNATLFTNESRKKYCLDILPTTKADATNYLIDRLKLERGVVAGDSGNDIDMLLNTPKSFIAVAVGGHKAELQAALTAHTSGSKNYKPIFIDTDDNRKAAQSLLLFDGYLRGEDVPILPPTQAL